MDKNIKNGKYVILTDATHEFLVAKSSKIVAQSRNIKIEAKKASKDAKEAEKSARTEKKAETRDIIKYGLGFIKSKPAIHEAKKVLNEEGKTAIELINGYIKSVETIEIGFPTNPKEDFSASVSYECKQYTNFEKVGSQRIKDIKTAKDELIKARAILEYNRNCFINSWSARANAVRDIDSEFWNQVNADNEAIRQTGVIFVTNVQTFFLNMKHSNSEKGRVKAKWPAIKPGYKYMKKSTN